MNCSLLTLLENGRFPLQNQDTLCRIRHMCHPQPFAHDLDDRRRQRIMSHHLQFLNCLQLAHDIPGTHTPRLYHPHSNPPQMKLLPDRRVGKFHHIDPKPVRKLFTTGVGHGADF